MIKVENIKKSFAKAQILKNVSFEIQKGVIFGLLGPNGAGKTTLIRILCGILQADSGAVSINNQAIEKAKHLFGYVAQSFGQYEELSVWENLLFYSQMYGVKNQEHLEYLLKRYNLEKYKDRRAGKLSGGYQRRLALVCALVHDPQVLFLDEPTAGIDPVTRKLLWDDFYALSVEGKTLFVTTHYMEEAERCHELAFLASGNIVASGSPTEIQKALGDIRLFTLELSYNPFIVSSLTNIKGIILVNQFGTQLRLLLNERCNITDIQNLLDTLLESKVVLQESRVNLEDVFIALTQELAL